MHNNKLVSAIKVNGKVLRETGDTVHLPFGCEYSIYLKNLENKRAVVRIDIDGQIVTNGGLVLKPNSQINLERFITNNYQGNRFKFIERTSSIEEYRGVQAEDGLIRIEHEFEYTYKYVAPSEDDMKTWYGAIDAGTSAPSTRRISYGAISTMNMASGYTVFNAAATNDVGITVPGSVSNQSFGTTSFIGDGVKYVTVLRLKGMAQSAEPVTVNTKYRCTTCGKMNDYRSKFCSNCGTSLQIF